MTAQEKQTFLDEFLPKYLAGGFGSMPKSEIDLLIFHLLGVERESRPRIMLPGGSSAKSTVLRFPGAWEF